MIVYEYDLDWTIMSGKVETMDFSKTKVDIANMKVNSMGSSCSLSLSQNFRVGNYPNTKRSEGFGEESGDHNLYWHTVSYVDDEDFSDSDAIQINF